MQADAFNATNATLSRARASVPPGRWALAVSGGADSVAMLRLLATRSDLAGVVAHVDHELRGRASRADAEAVRSFADRLNWPCVVGRRSELEPSATTPAALRRMRLDWFARLASQHDLRGVILAHHADDEIETVLLRVLRGSARSGTLGLRPLAAVQQLGPLEIRRPMLGVGRRRLRQWLTRIGQPWREDASNAEPVSLRNRLRHALATRPDLREQLRSLTRALATSEAWMQAHAVSLRDVSAAWPLRRRAARQYLVEVGVPQAEAGPSAVDRLLAVADRAGPRAAEFAGGVRVERKRGELTVQRHDLAPPSPRGSRRAAR